MNYKLIMSKNMRFLDFVKPLMFLIQQIKPPNRKLNKRNKIVGNAIVLFIYLICCHIPLYGICKSIRSAHFTG